MPPDSPFAVSWWCRMQFQIPHGLRGRRLWLIFDSINYRANIWLNGREIAGSDQVVGMYRGFEFDVTDPQAPWDLSQFSSGVDSFPFLDFIDCRTRHPCCTFPRCPPGSHRTPAFCRSRRQSFRCRRTTHSASSRRLAARASWVKSTRPCAQAAPYRRFEPGHEAGVSGNIVPIPLSRSRHLELLPGRFHQGFPVFGVAGDRGHRGYSNDRYDADLLLERPILPAAWPLTR